MTTDVEMPLEKPEYVNFEDRPYAPNRGSCIHFQNGVTAPGCRTCVAREACTTRLAARMTGRIAGTAAPQPGLFG